MSDSEQCSNVGTWTWQLISLLVNFLCDTLGHNNDHGIMYLQLYEWVIQKQYSNRLELDLISLLVNFYVNYGQ